MNRRAAPGLSVPSRLRAPGLGAPGLGALRCALGWPPGLVQGRGGSELAELQAELQAAPQAAPQALAAAGGVCVISANQVAH